MPAPRISALSIAALFAGGVCAQQVPDRDYRAPIAGATYEADQGPVVCVDEAHFNFHTLEQRFWAFGELLRRDGYRTRALFGLGMQPHSDSNFCNPLQRAARNLLDEILAVLAVAIGGRDFDSQLVAGVLAFQLALESWHEIAMPLQVGEGLGVGRTVDDFPGIILEGVVERDDGVFLDGGQGGCSK